MLAMDAYFWVRSVICLPTRYPNQGMRMSEHPYKHLPDWHYWKRSVAKPAPKDVDPVIRGKFRIRRSDRVATAGSCFAQHIARYLQEDGFNYFISEEAHPIIPPQLAKQYGFGQFTARYGNIYTSRQLVQLLNRAYDLCHPADDIWFGKDGRIIDPFRPRLQKCGFASVAEYRADRRRHFEAVRKAVEQLDVLVFTLGMTEMWVSKSDGAVYPLCPGVEGGEFDPNVHLFVNLRVSDVVEDLRKAVEFIRARNQNARFIFTVSPVPLVATFESRSVLVSSTYSKSVLRVAAEEIASSDERIAYFPSFEIITGNHTRGRFFEDDLRSVTEEGVRRVMGLFIQHFTEAPSASEKNVDARHPPLSSREEAVATAMAVMCDEEALDRS
jgi:hypothetical protein